MIAIAWETNDDETPMVRRAALNYYKCPELELLAGEAVVTSGGRLYCIFYLELQLCLATAGHWARLGRHFPTCDS